MLCLNFKSLYIYHENDFQIEGPYWFASWHMYASQGPTFLQHLKLFCPSIQFREPVGDVKPIARPYPIRKCCIYKEIEIKKN